MTSPWPSPLDMSKGKEVSLGQAVSSAEGDMAAEAQGPAVPTMSDGRQGNGGLGMDGWAQACGCCLTSQGPNFSPSLGCHPTQRLSKLGQDLVQLRNQGLWLCGFNPWGTGMGTWLQAPALRGDMQVSPPPRTACEASGDMGSKGLRAESSGQDPAPKPQDPGACPTHGRFTHIYEVLHGDVQPIQIQDEGAKEGDDSLCHEVVVVSSCSQVPPRPGP